MEYNNKLVSFNHYIMDWLDTFFQTTEEKLLNGNFKDVDDFLANVDPFRYCPEQLIGMLTITCCWKKELPNRKVCYDKIEKHFKIAYTRKYIKGLLIGLK